MTTDLLVHVGGPLGGLGLAVLAVGPARAARLGGLAAWTLGLLLLVPSLVPSGQGAVVAAGIVAAVAVAVPLAVLVRRRPWSLALLVLAAVPVRIPIKVGDESATLLVPLYALVVGTALALAWSLWRDEPRSRELGRVALPLGVFVAWLGLSAAWTGDPTKGAVELFFFILPFALLTVALARLPWSDVGVDRLGLLLLGMGVLFALVGIGQWAARDIFWNNKVVAGNAYASIFRVNSLFWDPSIYGRFLVVTILACVAVLLFARFRRLDWPLVAAVAVLWVGLFFSYSQSSFVALLAGLAVAAVLAWGRSAVVVVATLVVAVGVYGLVSPQLERVRRDLTASSEKRVNRATRGRFVLVRNALEITGEHPAVGVGVGGLERAYRRHGDLPESVKIPASHNTPVAVLAETGVPGLAFFVWLVAAGLLAAGRATLRAAGRVQLLAAVAILGLVAIAVHSLFYNAFLEDPMAWALLAFAALAAGATSARKVSG